jgi:polyisoprenoid-binding protein YceI
MRPSSSLASRSRAFGGGVVLALLVCLAPAAPVRAEPREFVIDPDHFGISFRVRHIGYADTLGLFLKASGRFVYDEETRTLHSARVVVDTRSVFTNHQRRDDHVRNSDFLDAESFPEAVFESTALELGADGKGTLRGTLTLLGKSRPVELAVSLNKAAVYPFPPLVARYTLGISASTTLRRSEWGMEYAVANGLVGDEVHMAFEIEANRE